MGRLRHRGLATIMLMLMALVVVPTQSWGQQAERIGTVLAVDGVAEARAANVTTWEPLQFRAALFPKDTVRTGPDSKVKILMRDDSIITLAERSEMEFTEFLLTPQQRQSVISLVVGKLRVVTTKIFGAGSGTEVRTANTVAGVRGTTFVVIFIPPSTTEVLGFDGVVTVRNLNPAIPQIEPLQQNFRTRVVGNAAPSRAAVLPVAERQAVERELSLREQVPVEVKPTGEGQTTGKIRGESGEEKQAERSGTPDPNVPPKEAQGRATSENQLNQLLRHTQKVLEAQAFEPPSSTGTSGVITPDNPASQTALMNNTTLQPLRLTITIPRN